MGFDYVVVANEAPRVCLDSDFRASSNCSVVHCSEICAPITLHISHKHNDYSMITIRVYLFQPSRFVIEHMMHP